MIPQEFTQQMVDSSDSIVFQDPSILFNKDRLTEFIPLSDHTVYEKFNAICRLVIYVSVLLSIYNASLVPVFMGTLAFGGLYLFWKIYSQDMGLDKVRQIGRDGAVVYRESPEEDPVVCLAPTTQNPFMNETDGLDYPVPPPCINQELSVEEKFRNDLFEDVNDLYDKRNRQFLTLPRENRDDFVNFLAQDLNNNCKTDSRYCQPYEDLRYQKPFSEAFLDVKTF